MASVDSVDITVKGKGGLVPIHTTIDPVVIASRIVLALQAITSRGVPLNHRLITVAQFMVALNTMSFLMK